MNAKLVQVVEGMMIASTVAVENLVAAMEVRGFKVVRINSNPRHRPELQGLPVFDRMYGPMWDGGDVRYEDAETYRQLSA